MDAPPKITCVDCRCLMAMRCPSGIRVHVHCPICRKCTRISDYGRRSCGGGNRDIKLARRDAEGAIEF
jgi:hypothetical protein